VLVGIKVGVEVRVGVAVGVLVAVEVGVEVNVGEAVGVLVAVEVGVGEAVGVPVAVAVGMFVGSAYCHVWSYTYGLVLFVPPKSSNILDDWLNATDEPENPGGAVSGLCSVQFVPFQV